MTGPHLPGVSGEQMRDNWRNLTKTLNTKKIFILRCSTTGATIWSEYILNEYIKVNISISLLRGKTLRMSNV